MGQKGSRRKDDFVGEGPKKTIQSSDEVFVEGQRPIVNQNPHTFNDDDPVNIYSSGNNGPQYSVQPYDLYQNVQIHLKTSGLENQQHQAVLMQIVTKDQQMIDSNGNLKDRQGIDLVCLIDHSGSMQGEKITLVKQTLTTLLEVLNERDRLSIIMFDCQCYRLTRLMRCTPANGKKFRIAINFIFARGGTNIGNGMKMALSVLKHRRYKNPVSAIFLLSDGVDEGAEDRVRDDLRQYNIKDPFVIKTFGFGRDCCPKLMSEIAHLKEGQFYFLPNLNQIDMCFMEAFGGLISVIANNVKLTVRHPTHHISLKKAFGDKWQIDRLTNTYHLYQPHLLCGLKKEYVIEVQVSGHTTQQLQVKLELHSIEGQVVEINKSIELDRVHNNNYNKEVIANFYRVQGAETFEQARIAAESGDYQYGNQILYQMQQKIMAQNFNDNPQVQMVSIDLAMTRQHCNSETFATEGRHHMHQLSMVHMYQKPRGVDITTENGEQSTIDCPYQNSTQKEMRQTIKKIRSQSGSNLRKPQSQSQIQQSQQAPYYPNKSLQQIPSQNGSIDK